MSCGLAPARPGHHQQEDCEKPEADDELVHEMLSSVVIVFRGFSSVKARVIR